MTNLGQLAGIAIGGAVGSVLRFISAKLFQNFTTTNFPLGILIVNFLGCFLIGLLATIFLERFDVMPFWRATILVGFLGGFTTFSTFTNDTINMFQLGNFSMAILYIFSSLILCLMATWFGVLLVRSI